MKKSSGKELSKVAETVGTDFSWSMLVGVTTNFVKEDDDKDLFPTDGLLVEEVDLELAVEFLVLERDLDRGWTETLAGVISILE